MSPSWQDVIASLSIQTTPCKLENEAIYPLTSQAFLQVAGPDALRFLQGQLSCDVAKISQTQSGLGSHNTHQGRMRSSFRICQYAENGFLLRVHASIVDLALTALAKYIVFSKAKISKSHDWVGIGLHGDNAVQELGKHFSLVPCQDMQQHIEHNTLLICTSAALKSYEIYTDTACALTLWPQLTQNLPIRNATQHQLLENRLGLAFVEAGTHEAFIPQMFNYQATSAISFTKGCYTGQEIVARMKYLGKLKRHMHHYTADCDAEVAAGDPITDCEKNQNIGNIVSAVKTGERNWDLLIVITDAGDVASSLCLGKGRLENIKAVPLPYKVED